MPFDRHKAILEAERKARTDLEAKWQRVSWVEELVNQGLTPDQAREAVAIHGHLQHHPAAFVESLLSQAVTRPDLAQAVRSIAARVLGSGSAQSEAGADAEPQPDYYVQEQDGSRTPFMSATTLAKWQAWHKRQLTAEFDRRMGPLEQAEASRRQTQALQDLTSQVYADTKAELDAMRQRPHFKEHEADIKAYLADHGWKPSLHEAYTHVLTTKVLPTLSQTARDSAIAEMQKQAHAGSVNPRGGAPSTPAAPKGFDDPGLKWS